MKAGTPTAEELADFAHQREAYEVHWMDDRIKLFLDRNIVIPRTETDSNEIRDDGGIIATGSGPEWASADVNDNPNWLRNRAQNILNLADYIENRHQILAAKKAEADASLARRRDELVDQLSPRMLYSNVSAGLQRAVDRIIELEGASK